MKFDPRKIKKVELHVHLDTCLSYYYIKTLYPETTLLEYNERFVAHTQCLDLGDFIKKITPQLTILQTSLAIELAVDDLFDQLHSDNIIYTEIRFAPLLHVNKDLSAEKVIETVLEAMKRCGLKYAIKSKLIICTLRHFTKEQSIYTAKLAAKYLPYGVAALDLAADEARYSLDNHIAAFDYMHEMGGGCIAHAGEALGHVSILETIKLLNVSRIGHGVNCIDDLETVELIKSKNIHLEICPSCNIVCNIFGTIEEHPIDKIKNLGVSIGVNTDARTVANTTLNNEYLLLNERFGWQRNDFIECNISAIKASFINSESKAFLCQEIVNNS